MKKAIKLYIGVFRQEIMRLFNDWKIYLCLLLYFAVCILTAVTDSKITQSAVSAMVLINSISNLNKLLVFLAAVPFATSFCDDWSGKYMNYIIMRSSRNSYITAKVTVCALISFGISFVGLLFYAIFNVIRGGIGVEGINKGVLFYDIAHGSMPFLVVIVDNFLFSMVSSVYAVMGFALSAVIPNRFVAVTAPLFMNVFMEQIMNHLPKALNLFRIQYGNSAFHAGSLETIAFSFMVSAGYILIAGMVFAVYVGRRIRNEIV